MNSKVRLALSWGIASLTLVPNVTGIAPGASTAKRQYDFIIVGGGTAGNVVANRLTENADFNVLVLEAGPSNEGALESAVPFLCTDLTPNTPYDWNYTTVPQPGLNGRSVPYPRGHILGGSSAVNYLLYTRGTFEDFNRYANVSGDQGWSWDSLQPYFKKNEKFQSPVDGHNTTGQFDPAVHSYTGMNPVSLAGFPSSIDRRVMDASQELGGSFKFNLDQNSGRSLGLGWVQTATNHSQRSSSATSYLSPEYMARPNLHVIVGAQVSRLLQSGTENGLPAFRSVEFLLSSRGPLQTLTANNEVILSAGAIGSPHILMNSGIGNATALESVGVTSIVDLPDVGENMSDHALGAAVFSVSDNSTYDDLFRSPALRAQELDQWETTGLGRYVDTVVDHLVFARITRSGSVFRATQNPAAGPNTPNYEILIANGYRIGPTPSTGHYLTLGTAVMTPTSRGSIKLKSNNPFDAPLIDPALLQTNFDKAVMREAIKSALNFVTASSWKGYVISPLGGLQNATTNAEIDAYIAATSGTSFHPVGTSSMSPRGARNGVVNPDLTVKGVAGLRIVDASVLPFVPSAHVQVPTYIVGERASDLIKATYQ